MKTPRSSCPPWLINLYGFALYFYPKSFREEYREPMLQAFLDNYRHQQKFNPAFFLLETIGDLGVSMSNEHFSHFSKHGRIKMAIFGLCLALGFLALRPFLTESLTDGFVFIGDFDQRIDTRLYSHYAIHRRDIAEGLLSSADPLTVMAGAQSFGDMRWDANLKTQTALDVKNLIERALKNAHNDSSVLLAAYPVCAANPEACNAESVLNHLKSIAPDNGMVWLYAASLAKERGDSSAQKMYLSKALAAQFFDNPQNVMNARLHFFYVQKPYKLPWYSFVSKENHAIAEWFVWPIENYAVPGCIDTIKSSPDIQILCRDTAKRIAAQPSNSLTMRLMATALAVKLGATELQAELDLLRLQNNAFSETIWKTNLVSPGELAKAYENGKQYELAVHTIEKYRLFEKTK